LEFGISLHEKDRAVLEEIQKYFSAGNFSKHPTLKILNYRLSFKDLEKIIKHFDRYPLITQKLADFELFKLAYKLILNKEHLKLALRWAHFVSPSWAAALMGYKKL
jgi:hypothetical protein